MNNGIGRATAILFAKLGAKVAVLDINSEAAANGAVDQRARGQVRLGMASRCVESGCVDKTVKELLEKYKRIDVWAHIVGGHKGRTLIEEIPLDLWSNMEET